MEFSNERHHHHRHHQRDDDEERQNYPPPGTGFDQPPPPPPPSYYREDQPPPSYYGVDQPPPLYYGEDQPPPNSYYGGADRPPPTQVSHVSHSSFHGHPPPPSQGFLHQPPPPPVHSFNYQSEEPTPPVTVHHVAHQVHHDQQSPAQFETHHTSHTSHLPSFHPHASSSYFSNKPTFRVFTKADPNFPLAITEGKVILARSHETDDFQHWYKDEKYSTRVKDEERFPSFALVNKATGQALKHSIGATHPVQLIPYNPDILDESILWTESADLGDGFRTVRMFCGIKTKEITSDGRLYLIDTFAAVVPCFIVILSTSKSIEFGGLLLVLAVSDLSLYVYYV
ncbi:hypothetical protein L3X38_036047 [Prunus dulcis]|uniref:Uncharacterized protein n=1 Tax=Prunus dulcis TaxID=3755 RepID=A0AAD4V0P1_PRUDU|nr:hypothetical protein L3X38_036047 [Prunus dulcis]